MARRLRAERRFTGAVQTALDAALDELRRAETPAAGLPPAAENSVLSFLFDLARHTASLVRLTTAAARAALTDAGEQLAEELGQDDPWTMPDEQALAYLRARENKIRAASESIFASIKDEIDTGLREGESPQQLTRRVEDAMPGITREKAETIARTETGAAYGQARQAGLADAGIEFKEWVTARDENVRATHVALDGVIVPLGAKFKVGESWLDFPCDPDGPPGEVINCRCIQVASHGPATKTT
jgi:SPP1 gp7 family putative phage head morphogenesis protein